VVEDPRFADGGRWIESTDSISASDVPSGPVVLRLPAYASGVLVTEPATARADTHIR
jgi:hypothetical protein